ncbi:MAG TPA: ABC transporter ATP-binding protein [Candidatus Saccharimonadales bacterium]|nr:ABC transporter ATP-binding protein [Candidatus Saccharimonadales bacterium]
MTKRTTHYYSLRSYLTFMGQHKWRFTLTVLAFAVADVQLAIMPVFIGKLVGALAAHPMQGHRAIVDMVVLIVLSSGHNLIWQVSEYVYRRLIRPLSFEYENMLFRLVIRKPYPYFVDKFTGKVSSYINTIRQEQGSLFDELCYNYVNEPINLIAILAILTNINWQTGLIFAVGLTSMFLVGRHTVRNSVAYEKKFADAQSTKNAKIIDAIANFVNVKSFRRESREIHSIQAEQAGVISATQRSGVWNQVFWYSMSVFVRDIIWPGTIGLNVYLFLHGELSIGHLATILSTLLLFTSGVWEVIWYISQFNLRLARTEEAHQYLFGQVNIMQLPTHVTSRPDIAPALKASLQLSNINFAYPDKPETSVLHNLNLSLRQGEKIGIVGKSGSGKSTITKLLLAYYELQHGALLLDGQPVTTADIAEIVSYVPQDTSLFHRSIADNIAYATDRDVTHDEIVQAAKLAHAHEFVQKISDGYDALVGERGVKLSVGQRQRIAIARAILDNKPLLILDEATSALDSESEVLVQEALENLWANKTVIAIAHRLSTLRHMDKIAVMDQGEIVELGTHSELLAAGGIYAKLWMHQSGGFIEE